MGSPLRAVVVVVPLALGVAGLALLACDSFGDGTRPTPAAVDASAPAEAGALQVPETGAPEAQCPDGGDGPPMVRVTALPGSPFCIDRTEVSATSYAAFVARSLAQPKLLDDVRAPRCPRPAGTCSRRG